MSIGVLVLEIKEWARLRTDHIQAGLKEIGEKAPVLAPSGGVYRRDALKPRSLKVDVLAGWAELRKTPWRQRAVGGAEWFWFVV